MTYVSKITYIYIYIYMHLLVIFLVMNHLKLFDQVLCPYKNNSWSFINFNSKQEEKKPSGPNCSRHSLNLVSSLIYSCMQFWYVTVIHKYWKFATFSNDLLAIFMFWFCPAFCSLGINICLVSAAFTSRPTCLPATDNFCFSYSMFIFHNLEFWLWSKNFANFAFNVTVVCKSCYPFKLTLDPNLWHLMNCSVKLTFSMWPLNTHNS